MSSSRIYSFDEEIAATSGAAHHTNHANNYQPFDLKDDLPSAGGDGTRPKSVTLSEISQSNRAAANRPHSQPPPLTNQLSSIRHLLNQFYCLQDINQRIAYESFNWQQESKDFMLFIMAILVVVILPVTTSNLIQDITVTYDEQYLLPRLLIDFLSVFCAFTFLCSLLLLCFTDQVTSLSPHASNAVQLAPSNTPPDQRSVRSRTTSLLLNTIRNFIRNHTILNTWMSDIKIRRATYAFVSFQVSVTCVLPFIRKVYNLACVSETSSLAKAYGEVCYDEDMKINFILNNALFLILVPGVIYVGLPELPLTWVWNSCAFTAAVFILTLGLLDAWAVLPTGIIFFALFYFIIGEFQIRNLLVYLTYKRLQELMIENTESLTRSHAEEMRHMIANVAHDLKTPLSSFLTGLDYIQMAIDDFTSSANKTNATSQNVPSNTSTDVNDLLDTIESCLHNIRNTNSFMLMTINRCIDYTKASKGLKLVPRYETIDLMETLQLPLSCMQNIQNRIEIRLHEVSREICSHIITDKQWLQENVLCLLSNAVKYSSEGEVTISVTVETANAVDGEDDTGLPNQTGNGINSTKSSFISGSDIRIGESFFGSTRRSVSPVQARRSLMFEIEDTGIGMSDEAMQSLFNPFKQNQTLAGGTGLGLYSLAKRIEALHGEYGVRKRHDGKQGSLFWFSIPYKADEITASLHYVNHHAKGEGDVESMLKAAIHISTATSTSDQMKAIQMKKNLKVTSPRMAAMDSKSNSFQSKLDSAQHWRILLADDAPSILKMTSMMLRKSGHEVKTAENGEVAWRLFQEAEEKKQSFDVILMDLQMPVMDGLEATRRIRMHEAQQQSLISTPGYKRQLIIAVSANADDETTEEAFQAGMDDFVSKPFHVSDLFNVVAQFKELQVENVSK